MHGRQRDQCLPLVMPLLVGLFVRPIMCNYSNTMLRLLRYSLIVNIDGLAPKKEFQFDITSICACRKHVPLCDGYVNQLT